MLSYKLKILFKSSSGNYYSVKGFQFGIYVCVFKSGFHHVSNSQSCFSLLSAGITGVYHQLAKAFSYIVHDHGVFWFMLQKKVLFLVFTFWKEVLDFVVVKNINYITYTSLQS
jgi:hypothetical protein